MWLSLIENPETFRSVYKNQIPELQNVFLHELKIINGEEIHCYLRFDLEILPQEVPEKWRIKKVNKVQLDIGLTSSEIVHFNMAGRVLNGNIQIKLLNNSKWVSFIANEKEIFIIKTQWIHIRSMTGYYSEMP